MPNQQNKTEEDNEGEIIQSASIPHSSQNELLINTYINKGYSLIGDQSDLIFRPASTLSKYSIFDHKINIDDVLKGISTDEIILEKFETAKINKGQRQIKEYDYNEIKNAIDFVIHGEYKLPYHNFLYQRGQSIRDLKTKKTVMYIHEKIDFTLTINSKKNFPKLSKAFIADAIKIFDKPEVKEINQDKEFVKNGLNFFNKYGTNYLNRTKYGSRFVWISEINITKWDNQPSSATQQDTSNFKSGSIAFENSRDRKNDRLNNFEISAELGNCQINMMENRMENCNGTISSVGLLGFEVEYLYRVFESEKIKAPILQPDNTPLPADRIKNIYTNMKMLLDSLVSAVDVRNPYVKDFISYNNFRADYGDALPCTNKIKISRFGDIPNSLYYYDTSDNRFIPVFKVSQENKVNFQNVHVLSKSRTRTFLCNMKDRLFDQAIIDSPYLFNKRYLIDIGLFNYKDFEEGSPNKNKTLGYAINDCQNFWVSPKSNFETKSNVKVLFICLKYGNVFLDNKIITDVKIKNFLNNECKSFNFLNRDYECLCDQEIKILMKSEDISAPAANSDVSSGQPLPQSSGAPNNTDPNNANAADASKKVIVDQKKKISKFLCYARKIFKD